jgi:hypothetical protein
MRRQAQNFERDQRMFQDRTNRAMHPTPSASAAGSQNRPTTCPAPFPSTKCERQNLISTFRIGLQSLQKPTPPFCTSLLMRSNPIPTFCTHFLNHQNVITVFCIDLRTHLIITPIFCIGLRMRSNNLPIFRTTLLTLREVTPDFRCSSPTAQMTTSHKGSRSGNQTDGIKALT